MLIGGSIYSSDILVDAGKLFPKEPDKAVKLLKKHIKNKDNDLSIKCRIRLAEHYNAQKKFKDTTKLLKKYVKFNSLKQNKVPYRSALEAYGEYAFASGASGDIYNGLKNLNIAGDRTENLENAIISYYYAKLLHYYAKDKEALKYISKGYATADKYLKSFKKPEKHDYYEDEAEVEDSGKPEREYWQYLEPKLNYLKDDVELALFALEYGKDYGLYRWARRRQLKGHYRKASGYYERILEEFPMSPLADAAQCYLIDCRLQNSDYSYRDIEKEALAFIKKSPYSLYRGETSILLARCSLESFLDVKRAEKYYSQAYDFCERSRSLSENKLLFSLKDNVKKAGIVDLPFETYDSAYRLMRRKINPGEITNRETNRYYIDNLQKKCAFALGFIRFSQGKTEEALKLFNEVGKFDKEMLGIDAKNMPNALARLRGACNQGFFYLNQEELKYFKGKDRLRILLADFYFSLEKPGQSRKIYSDMLSFAEKEKKVCLLLRLADCQMRDFEIEKAEKTYIEALKFAKKMKTPLYHALHDLGCFYSSQGKKEESYEYLKAATRKGKKTYYGRLAHYRLFNDMGMRGDLTAAKREYIKFCETYSEKYSEATIARLKRTALKTKEIIGKNNY